MKFLKLFKTSLSRPHSALWHSESPVTTERLLPQIQSTIAPNETAPALTFFSRLTLIHIINIIVFTFAITHKIEAKVYCVHPTETTRLKHLMHSVNLNLRYDETIDLRVDGFLKDADFKTICKWMGTATTIDLRKAHLKDVSLPYMAFSSASISDSLISWGDTYSSWYNSIYLPDYIKEIGAYAFWGVTINDELYLPDSIEELGMNAFYWSNIKCDFKLPVRLKVIREGCFDYCLGLKDISIPEGIDRLESGVFHCPIKGYLDIPCSVKYIGRGAILATWKGTMWSRLGDGLSELYVRSEIPPECHKFAFFYNEEHYNNYINNRTSVTTLYVPVGCAEAYRNAPGWDYFENIVETDQFPE